jgi:hypothetical protein
MLEETNRAIAAALITHGSVDTKSVSALSIPLVISVAHARMDDALLISSVGCIEKAIPATGLGAANQWDHAENKGK